ncbi:hypothetical protein [Bacillus toyonensis]|uniref:hypothetical protein n=1 Tax=Bacillus toyonensis TaxID=155322 RepID=UPI000BFC0500|nr:hypothetical protein [Bacillus toyonensis]PHC14385.1 hypothetical protein COF03_25075 [Bacillus toyonensis]
MEVIITDIGIDQTEVYHGNELNYVDLSVAKISFYIQIYKSGERLSGEHEMSFEKYRKMTHDELAEHIKEVFAVA